MSTRQHPIADLYRKNSLFVVRHMVCQGSRFWPRIWKRDYHAQFLADVHKVRELAYLFISSPFPLPIGLNTDMTPGVGIGDLGQQRVTHRGWQSNLLKGPETPNDSRITTSF